ncbi:MAG: GNAT family N-acetyltransferase [Sarcina sp.]
MGNIICIIQARVGSTRLPNKVLKIIKGKTILEHVIDRVLKANHIDNIVIATTDRKQDDSIVNLLIEKNIAFYRGSENDVLERYYWAAKRSKADIIVRITSDCPLIDYKIIDKMLIEYKKNNFDYYSNTITRTFPRGLDVEIFSLKSLEIAYENANLDFEREHVTPYIWKRKNKFKIGQYLDTVDNSNIRVTLDTREDFIVMKDIYEKFYKDEGINIHRVIKYLNELGDKVANYEIEQKDIQQKVYLRSVQEEDINFLLELRNDLEVRKNSFNEEILTLEKHLKWFKNRDLEQNKYYLLTDGIYKIGSVYLLKGEQGNEISYMIHKDFRGMGYGKLIINMIENEIDGELIAKVKKENYISNKIFEKLGYSKLSEKNLNIYIKVKK